MHETILQSVGHTPLVRLKRLAADVPAPIAVKVESANPGGSVKDRVGMAMIAEAERHGWLQPGGTIIEATAGNTGVGLAMVAAVKGYRCIFVLPDKMSREKVQLAKAYGAEVVITPTNVPPDSPESYNGVAERLAREIPGGWRPNQFANLANPEIHYRTTGPEIWEQTEGKLTVFVSGVGTGGTLSGVARYLKERNPEIKIIGADPDFHRRDLWEAIEAGAYHLANRWLRLEVDPDDVGEGSGRHRRRNRHHPGRAASCKPRAAGARARGSFCRRIRCST
jgi:cystathionine beta-synthase